MTQGPCVGVTIKPHKLIELACYFYGCLPIMNKNQNHISVQSWIYAYSILGSYIADPVLL